MMMIILFCVSLQRFISSLSHCSSLLSPSCPCCFFSSSSSFLRHDDDVADDSIVLGSTAIANAGSKSKGNLERRHHHKANQGNEEAAAGETAVDGCNDRTGATTLHASQVRFSGHKCHELIVARAAFSFSFFDYSPIIFLSLHSVSLTCPFSRSVSGFLSLS